MRGLRNIIYLSMAIGLIIYAVPQLEMGQGLTLPTIFSIAWIGIILLIVAAHLHQLIGVDEEAKQELARIKAFKRWKVEQFLLRKSKGLSRRKTQSS